LREQSNPTESGASDALVPMPSGAVRILELAGTCSAGTHGVTCVPLGLFVANPILDSTIRDEPDQGYTDVAGEIEPSMDECQDNAQYIEHQRQPALFVRTN
jgi:hypothetical protein